jgi:hypothetical protein
MHIAFVRWAQSVDALAFHFLFSRAVFIADEG